MLFFLIICIVLPLTNEVLKYKLKDSKKELYVDIIYKTINTAIILAYVLIFLPAFKKMSLGNLYFGSEGKGYLAIFIIAAAFTLYYVGFFAYSIRKFKKIT